MLHKNKKHGLSKTPAYHVWYCMIRRCTNPKDRNYARYHARGITVCARWKSFENFFADMGPQPQGLSLDRRDNNRGYSKSNCRWATRRQQSRNTAKNILVQHRGKTRLLLEVCEEQGLSYAAIRTRIYRYKITPDEALKYKHRRKRSGVACYSS